MKPRTGPTGVAKLEQREDFGGTHMRQSRKVLIGAAVAALFLLVGSVMRPRESRLVLLIRQFKGEGYYFAKGGVDGSFFDRWRLRHFDIGAKVEALRGLGDMGHDADAAVPELVNELLHGPN